MNIPQLSAGLGEYRGFAHFVFNQSRLTTWQRCNRQHYHTYIDNLVTRDDTPLALEFGSWWHDCAETFFHDGLDAALRVSANTLHRLLDDRPTDEGAIAKFGEWAENALPIYAEHYEGESNPLGRVLATELPFWLRIDYRGMTYVMLGTFDALAERHGRLCVGEHKTVAAGTDFATFLTLRQRHPQHVGYGLAAYSLARDAELRQRWGVREGEAEIVYDLARKDAYPLRASRNGTLEERRDAWAAALLHSAAYVVDGAFMLQATDFALDVRAYYLGEHSRTRSLNACTWPGGSVACPVFDVCHHDVHGGTTERPADYVDATRKRVTQ